MEMYTDSVIAFSGVNKGGLGLLYNGEVRWAEGISASGIYADRDVFIRCYQDSSIINLIHRDGSRLTLAYEDLWDLHDVMVIGDFLYVVATLTNEVAVISLKNGDILNRKIYPGEPDSWHLNCLDVWDGQLVVSCFGSFNKHREYTQKSAGQGFVMEVWSSKILWEGLSQPHCPKHYGGAYYVCDSQFGRLLVRIGGEEIAADLGEYPRGLLWHNHSLYCGLSVPRSASAETGTIVQLNPRTLEARERFTIPFPEVYNIISLPSYFAKMLKWI